MWCCVTLLRSLFAAVLLATLRPFPACSRLRRVGPSHAHVFLCTFCQSVRIYHFFVCCVCLQYLHEHIAGNNKLFNYVIHDISCLEFHERYPYGPQAFNNTICASGSFYLLPKQITDPFFRLMKSFPSSADMPSQDGTSLRIYLASSAPFSLDNIRANTNK